MSDDFSVGYGRDGDFEKDLPSVGEHQAVVCQIHTLGYQVFQGKISKSPKCVFVFELDQKMTSGELAGKSFVISQRFAQYMGGLKSKSNLRVFLESWAGRALSEEEAQRVDLRKMLGRSATILIGHEARKDGKGMKAKIIGVARPKSPAIPITYTEVPKWITEEKAKSVAPPAKKQEAVAVQTQEDSDTLPF